MYGRWRRSKLTPAIFSAYSHVLIPPKSHVSVVDYHMPVTVLLALVTTVTVVTAVTATSTG
jgi:hypothetical protein